jgi:hypothetical protein
VGLLAKSATKKRVTPVTGPVNEALAGTPWLTNGAIPAGALIRSAVLALDLTGARSTQSRGPTSVFTPSAASHLWVESFDMKSWRFTLGACRVPTGIAVDWLVELTIDGTESATLRTTNWLTKDDTLVHGDHHDALRTELLRSLALGQTTEASAEADLSASSLKLVQTFERPGPDALEVSCLFSTTLDETTLGDRLRLMGHRVVERTSSEVTYGLGLPKHHAADFAVAKLGSGGVEISGHVSSDTPMSRRMAAADLRALIARLQFLLKNKDENVSFSGPAEWAP